MILIQRELILLYKICSLFHFKCHTFFLIRFFMSELENNKSNNQVESTEDLCTESIFQGPSEFKTTATVGPPFFIIEKEKQVNITDFLHILLSSFKDLTAIPTSSCEKAYPPLLRKAFSRDEIRRIKKQSEVFSQNKDLSIEELKKKISMIPDFSSKYDYLLKEDNFK